MNARLKKLDSLTGLRFYLAMFVVLFHGIIQAHLELGEQALPAGLLRFVQYTFNGQFAVSSFFVLSGFVMWYSYSERSWTYMEFLGNRVARLFPVYLLGIAIVLLRWNSLIHEFETTDIVAIQRLLVSLFMLQSWGIEWRATQMFNGPSWTLSVEMFFYVTFPLLFWINRRSKPLFFAFCGGIAVLMLLLKILTPTDYAVNPLGIPFCLQHWGYFTLGVLLCDVWKRGLFRINPGTILILPLLFFGYQLSQWLEPTIVAMAVPALVIGSLANADLNGVSSRWFASKWAVLGGEISYAIYILHAPIQTIIYSLFFRCGVFLKCVDSLLLKLIYLTICIMATLVVAYLAWRFIEVPARKRLAGYIARKTA